MTVSRIARALSGAVLLAAAGLLLAWSGVRQLESELFAALTRTTIDSGAYSSSDAAVVYLNAGTRGMFGLEITSSCTIAYPLAGFLLLLAFLAQVPRWSLARVWLAGLGSTAVLVAVNQVRLLGIAFASREWGLQTGYEISHRVVGTVITLVGLVLAIAIVFAVIGRDSRAARAAA
ncbi:hypothetical protein GCM10010174_17880 [Kutzneria viridogrisea]|uniref:Uncharacterized protein n=2 Tax=Kutzneria TaxID=43356 RepID=W5WFQ2_9PSEU|nr:hypothetical protein [Kutzneria albida]AHH99637.1 hypothetical protein KALB_6277 [Kutzneria albida DSM 43870]MBA8922807.1 exosortase/archaeosortase family protein [Kutzneria viridogrisea]